MEARPERARAGAGVNNIPLDKCAEKGVVVFNTPGANANGVKELVVAGLLLASRDLKFFYKTYHSTNRLPADTVAWGTAWGTPSGQTGVWVDGGYTQGGLGFAAEIGRSDIRMDQSIDPVLRPATG